jgi:hypothetical protein
MEKNNSEFNLFNDSYNIDERFQQIKEIVIATEVDLFKFIGPTKNKKAAIRIRKNMMEIKRLTLEIRQGIRFQRQDNDSDYEGK